MPRNWEQDIGDGDLKARPPSHARDGLTGQWIDGREPRKTIVLRDLDTQQAVREAVARGDKTIVVDDTRLELRVKGDWILFRRGPGRVPIGQLALRR